jgi:methyl-accepting chemotaxis protein
VLDSNFGEILISVSKAKEQIIHITVEQQSKTSEEVAATLDDVSKVSKERKKVGEELNAEKNGCTTRGRDNVISKESGHKPYQD